MLFSKIAGTLKASRCTDQIMTKQLIIQERLYPVIVFLSVDIVFFARFAMYLT